MPFSFQHKGSTVRVSLKDIFKSSKELKEDLDAIARKVGSLFTVPDFYGVRWLAD